MKRKETMNGAHSYGLMTKFGLNSPKYQYQSLIAHSHKTHKTHIQELLDDGRSLRIVQHTESGCPTVKHPMAKKGCWCIEERRKRRKTAHSSSHPVHSSTAGGNLQNLQNLQSLHSRTSQNSTASSLRSSTLSTSTLNMVKGGVHTQNGTATLPPNHSLNGLQSLNHLRGAHAVQSNHTVTAPLIPNQSLIQQQIANQKAMNIINYYSNPLYRLNAATNPMLTVPTVSKTASDIAQSLLLNARTQTMYSSNRMQQLRMQHLLNERTLKSNGATTGSTGITKPNTTGNTTTTIPTSATSIASATTNALAGLIPTGTNDVKGSVLGARQHKDTVVFATGSGAEPPVKRRKKSRWSDK